MLSFKEAFQYFATSFWNKSKNTFLTIENGINGILLDPKYELVNSVTNNASITLPSLDTFDEIYIEMTNGENTIVHQASVKKGSLLSDNSAVTYREILLDGIHDTQTYVTYDIATNTITPSYCEGVVINETTNVTTSVYVKKYVVSETTTTLSSGIISYDDTKANLGTDNLQGAIEKLDDKIDGIEQTATNTSYNNTTSGLTSTNVQGAIDEVVNEVKNKVNYASFLEKKDINENTIESTLPYELKNSCALIYKNEIHILGGEYNNASYTKHYKWNGSSWASVSTLPYKFYQGCAVVYNNEIHILGGSGIYTKHYKWNGSSWTNVSTIPTYCGAGTASVVFNNEIYIMGSGANSSYSRIFYKWNGSSWTSVSSMPYDFYNGTAVIYNNQIHILAGNGNNTGHYKWNGSSWTSVSTIPYDANSGRAVVYNNQIHIFGGNTSSFLRNHYKWNGSSWSSESLIPYNFYGGCILIYNKKINILGGNGSSDTYTKHYSIKNGMFITGYVKANTEIYYPSSSMPYTDNLIEITDGYRVTEDGLIEILVS